MTRRALRPMTSAAGAAPVISKAEGLPCGAFGSIAVLIFSLLPFPRFVGGARRRFSLTVEKIAARTARRHVCGSGTSWLVWPGGEQVPVPGSILGAPGTRNGSFQTARRIHPADLLVKKNSTTYCAMSCRLLQ